jgi:hypothetical protein
MFGNDDSDDGGLFSDSPSWKKKEPLGVSATYLVCSNLLHFRVVLHFLFFTDGHMNQIPA